MPDRYDDIDKAWDDRTFKWYADFTDHPVRTIGVWVASIVALVLVLGLIGNVTGIANVYWQAEKAKLTIKPRVQSATYDTNNALVNIAYFHNACNDIVGLEQQVRNNKAQLAQDKATLDGTNWSGNPIGQSQAADAVTTDNSNVTGAEGQLANVVQDYDAKSATQTANPFKAHNLPYRIVINPATGLPTEPVTCH